MAKFSPEKYDPSRTFTLRRAFGTAIESRYRILIRRIVALVEDEDAFGLRRKAGGIKLNRFTLNQRWEFSSTPEQVAAFEEWMKGEFNDVVLDGEHNGALWESFIRRGYEQGAGRAFDDARKRPTDAAKLPFYQGTKGEFLKSAFGQPISQHRVKLLAGRVLTELKGVNGAMATAMMRELAEGLVRGDSPRVVARRLAGSVQGISDRRALTIARTETIRAHAEGQLDMMEILGVTSLGVAVEWSTAGFNVCPLCVPLEGVVFTPKQARGMLPRHPNCRCTWIPANVGEDKDEQKRTTKARQAALDESIEEEIPEGSKRSLKEQKQKTRWKGADVKPEELPASILDD